MIIPFWSLDDIGGHYLGLDADVWLKGTVLLQRQPVELGKVLLLAVTASTGSVAHDVAHLPGTEPHAEQGGAVGAVGVEGGEPTRDLSPYLLREGVAGA